MVWVCLVCAKALQIKQVSPLLSAAVNSSTTRLHRTWLTVSTDVGFNGFVLAAPASKADYRPVRGFQTFGVAVPGIFIFISRCHWLI